MGLVFLSDEVRDENDRKVAIKLHKQFAHPTAEKLVNLLRKAKASSKNLEKEIRSVTDGCEICIRFRRNPSRPVVALPMASKFNEAIAIDLKSYEGRYFLVVIDLFTRFCGAIVLANKMSPTVIKGLFLCWIVHFGAPSKILSDNGREFNSVEFQTFAESFNVKLLNTAAESPWSNGACEKLNGVLGKSVSKIREDSSCDVETALAWAVSARNALTNFSGFSPNQLVFGFNPGVPTSFDCKPPGLEEADASDIVRRNLSALHAARRDFVQVESDDRLRRALRSNIRTTCASDLVNGDEIFYKRNDSERWHGPGVVVGIDGKQVMVRHGGNLHRVHVCRLSRRPSEGLNETMSVDIANEGGTVASDRTADVNEAGGISSGVGKEVSDRHIEVLTDDEHGDEDEQGDRPNESTEDVEAAVDREEGRPLIESIETGGDGNAEVPLIEASRTGVRHRCWKTGERFEGRDFETGEVVAGTILSRAGKTTGVNRHCYNIRNNQGWTGWYDMSTLEDLQLVDESSEMLVLFCSDEVSKAKERDGELVCQ